MTIGPYLPLLIQQSNFTIWKCIKRGDLRQIGDLEVIWEDPISKGEGAGGIGNTQQSLLGYKLTKIFYYIFKNNNQKKA